MKLVHPALEMKLQLPAGICCQWVIESPSLMAQYLQELLLQASGEDGNFVLSYKDKELSIAKYAEIIINPFAVDINNKKVLQKLYSELSALAAGETLYMETQTIQAELQTYFYQLEHESAYMLECDANVDLAALFKTLNVKFVDDTHELPERLHQYIRVMAQLAGIRLFVFVNLRSYLTNTQLQELVEFAAYQEIAILLIESQQREFANDMPQYIIDVDLCEIF